MDDQHRPVGEAQKSNSRSYGQPHPALAAGCQHRMWKLSGGEHSDKPFEIEIPTLIGADIIQKAIATSYFYINQAEVLYKGQQQDEDDTVPVIQKLIQKSEELRDTVAEGWISTREAYRNCRELVAGAKLRQMSNTDFTAAVFNQMVSMNLGETKKVGKSFKWRIVR